MNNFIKWKFENCSLIWNLTVYNKNQSSFEHLLKKDCPVSTNHRSIRLFAIEINKFKNNISTSRMSELFEKRNLNYGLCSQTDFSLHSVKLYMV